MEYFDLLYKAVSFMVIPLMWQLRIINEKLESNGGKIGGIYSKIEKMQEEQSREHAAVGKSIHELEAQHANHEKDQAAQAVKTDEILMHVRCKYKK